jgi:hypothetical protein
LRRNGDVPELLLNGKQVAENGDEDASSANGPSPAQQTTPVNSYLVGAQLDEALAAGQDITISWPFADGDIRDWTQAEAIWYVCTQEDTACSLKFKRKHSGNMFFSKNCR